MEEDRRYDYDPSQYEEDDYQYQSDGNKSIRGYRIVIIILGVILVGISMLYFNLNRQQQADYELLKVDRDSIQSNLTNLIDEYDNLKYSNDTIAQELQNANEMLEQMKKERRWNYAKLKAYEKEVGTLRSVMKTYLRQIDSLNNLNKKLAAENISYKKEISTANLRADVAEERATELETRVQQGAVLRARDIRLACMNARDKVISRVRKATTLRVDFTISANDFARPGNRTVYACIISPDGYLLSTDAMPSFSYHGENKGYSAARDVDYQLEDVDVSIFYKGSGFTDGTYKIQLYADGNLIGTMDCALR